MVMGVLRGTSEGKGTPSRKFGLCAIHTLLLWGKSVSGQGGLTSVYGTWTQVFGRTVSGSHTLRCKGPCGSNSRSKCVVGTRNKSGKDLGEND